MDEDTRRTYTVPEAARILGISRPVAYDLIHQGRFPVPILHLGHKMAVSKQAVEDLLNTPMESSRPNAHEDASALEHLEPMMLRLASVCTYLIERVASLEHQLGLDDDQTDDMLDVLEEMRADLRALTRATRQRP